MGLHEIFVSLGVALAAGALIGAEREQAQVGGRADFGGIRTFPLISLLGALGALLLPVAGVWVLVVLLAVLGALLAVSHAREPIELGPGLSTEIAALLTFALGAMAALPQILPEPERFLAVAAGAAGVMALLALKRPLHGFAAKVSTGDVYATVKFVILVVVVLPMLPNETFGPLDVLNPFKVGLMIVLVAGLSFVGYVTARVVGGQRGLLLTGFVGGLVSSTAVTLTFSGRAKEQPELAPMCALAITVASATMFARIVAIVAVADPALVAVLAWPMGTMATVGFGLSLWLWWRETHRASRTEAVPLRNPFELKQAIKFGFVYAAILFIGKAAQQAFGEGGVYLSSLVAGIADVDAVTLSIAELHRQGLDTSAASTGITIAAATNTVVKAGIAIVLGGGVLTRRVVSIFLLVLAAGAVAVTLTR